MLKKNYRLSSVRLTNSKKVNSPLFNLRFAKNNLEFNRFAIVVSKKIDNRATSRNSLKRKFYSCIEEIFGKIGSGNDLVFYPSSAAMQVDRNEVMNELQKTLSKERLLDD